MVAGVKPENTKKLWDFLIKVTPHMAEYQRDGVGYAALSSETGLWGERWLYPRDAWKYRKEWSDSDKSVSEKFKNALSAEPRYESFGRISGTKTADTSHAVILHTRTATTPKCLANVHPFVYPVENTALIHNGSISNHEDLMKRYSTCDSEVILNEYVKNGVAEDVKNIQKVADSIRGYYACGVLTKDQSGREYLDIFRGRSAVLYAYYVPELETIVYCTGAATVLAACKELGWKVGSKFTFEDETFLRLDARTGELVTTMKFKVQYGTGSANGAWNNYNGTRSYTPAKYDDDDYYKNDRRRGNGYTPAETRDLVDEVDKKKADRALAVVRNLTEEVMKEKGQSQSKSTTTCFW
jgi:hypothetical protein